MGKRKFNKNGKDVVHFRLVHQTGKEREGAAKHVLEPYVPPNAAKKYGHEPELPEDLEEALGQELLGMQPLEDSDHDEDVDPDELDGDCYFPKDGYDYSQHLKTCGEGALVLVQDDAKQGAPQEGLSSSSTFQVPTAKSTAGQGASNEIMEALDALDVTDEYEELNDDMMEILVKGGGVDHNALLWNEATEQRNIKAGDTDEFMPELLADDLFDDEEDDGEAGPRAQRSAKADAEFLEMLEEYDDDEIGCLSEPETDEGEERDQVLEKCDEVAEMYCADKEAENKKMAMLFDPHEVGKYAVLVDRDAGLEVEPVPFEKTRALAERYMEADSDAETSDGENTEQYLSTSHQTEKDDWDCESILSTYSNTSNRPGRIIRPKIAKPKKKAVDPVIEEKEENEESDDSADDRAVALLDASTERPKNETPEEKKVRKAAVKALRQECRKLKKESKDTYKKEASKLSKTQIGTGDLRTQVRSIKI